MGAMACGLALAAALMARPAAADSGEDLQSTFLAELNFVRTQPAAYIPVLMAYRAKFKGMVVEERNRRPMIRTHEGVGAVDEAIAFLRDQAPLDTLAPSSVLVASADSHVRDQGPIGGMGHIGADGSDPGQRVDRYGHWTGRMAEDISYGFDASAKDVVRQLIVDDDVPDRGHRKAIFNPAMRYAGVACGPHKVYRFMCVIDFASTVWER